MAGFVLFAFIVPFANIAPQYAAPAPLDALPVTARPVYARFGGVELVGYETPDRRYAPGEAVPVTVYWRVLARSERDLSLYLHAVLQDGGVIGKVDSYPGGGRLRTSGAAWQPGAIYADTYAIPLERDAVGSSKLRIQVGWWDYPTEAYVRPTQEDGSPLGVVMLDAGGFAGGQPVATPDGVTRVDAAFGGKFRLLGYALQGDSLRLYWETLARPAADFTVFAQVVDANRNVVGQGDAPPDLPTHFWLPGERYTTRHTLIYPEPLESGSYWLLIGWYNPLDSARLDTDAPDDAVMLETITLP